MDGRTPTASTNRSGRKTAAIRQSALSAALSSFGAGRRFKSKPTFSGGENTAGRRWTAKEADQPDFAKDPEGNTTPKDSHMRLANPRDPEFLKNTASSAAPTTILADASSGQLDVGLVFVCYQANLADGFIFVQNLLNGEPLEEYISPFGGGYFFVLPGVGKGGFLGQGLPGV